MYDYDTTFLYQLAAYPPPQPSTSRSATESPLQSNEETTEWNLVSTRALISLYEANKERFVGNSYFFA